MKNWHCRLSLCLVLLLLCQAAFAFADAGSDLWTCSNCGQMWNQGNYCSNCGTPRPSSGNQADYTLEQIPGESGFVKVRLQSVSASSYIVNKQDPARWLPSRAADGNDGTCWQFSIRNQNPSSVTFEMFTMAPQTVNAVWIKNGFWSVNASGQDLFSMNCRARSVQLEFRYSDSGAYRDAVSFTLPDASSRWDWQRLNVGHKTNVVSVRLRVTSVYTGTNYPYDVCLNEVMLVQNRSSAGVQSGIGIGGGFAYGSGVRANLKMRLSTRSGPGTGYDEPGTFFDRNWQSNAVQVLGKAWDGANEIWWVLVDFQSDGARYRVWTGLKRVSITAESVPVISAAGQGTIEPTETRRGPGTQYAKGPTVYEWKSVSIYGRENGWIEVEYKNDGNGRLYRCWVPESKAHVGTFGGY